MAFRYWPFYCEENIWHLCADDGIVDGDRPIPAEERKVVVITGARGRVAMRGQRAGNGSVLWDYHVVLAARGRIWDLDTTLGLPVPAGDWIEGSFLPLHPNFPPRFRVVSAAVFRARFASDRSHMIGPRGIPLKPIPPWPPIGTGMTLPRFLDPGERFLGAVMDLDALPKAISS